MNGIACPKTSKAFEEGMTTTRCDIVHRSNIGNIGNIAKSRSGAFLLEHAHDSHIPNIAASTITAVLSTSSCN
jgi:hypothetical protein